MARQGKPGLPCFLSDRAFIDSLKFHVIDEVKRCRLTRYQSARYGWLAARHIRKVRVARAMVILCNLSVKELEIIRIYPAHLNSPGLSSFKNGVEGFACSRPF